MCLSPAAIEEGLRIQPRRRHGEQAVTTDLRKRRTGKDKAADKQAGRELVQRNEDGGGHLGQH